MLNQELHPAIFWKSSKQPWEKKFALKKNEFPKSSLSFPEGTSDQTNTTDFRQTAQAMRTMSKLCLNGMRDSLSHVHAFFLMSLGLGMA